MNSAPSVKIINPSSSRLLRASVFRGCEFRGSDGGGSGSPFPVHALTELSPAVILLRNSSAKSISHSVVTASVSNLVGDVFTSISRRKVLSSFPGRNKLVGDGDTSGFDYSNEYGQGLFSEENAMINARASA